MLIKVAERQVLSGPSGTESVIYSDPVELRDFNRASAILVVHYYHGDMTFSYATEVSDDLEAWTTEGPSDSFSSAAPPPKHATGGVHGRYARWRMWIGAGTLRTDMAFDLKVRLDTESFDQI